MIPIRKVLFSTVGQKLVMGLSGLALVGFIITHLLGNLSLYFHGSDPFNGYVAKLHSYGLLLLAAEVGLMGLFLVHIVFAFRTIVHNAGARPVKYAKHTRKGSVATTNTIGSRNMKVTGIILFIFLILHVAQFRFGAGVDQGYVTQIHGEEARDLYRLVREAFKNPVYVVLYMGAILFLWQHLKHGFWSAFQSLGVNNQLISKPLQMTAWMLAAVLALGFFLIPPFLYFFT